MGRSTPKTVATTIQKPASQATGRQRRDGRRPVGNSRGAKVTSSNVPGAPIQETSQAIAAPAGSEPGRVTSAYTEYWWAKLLARFDTAIAQKTQPMGLSVRRAETRAPTVANATNGSTYRASSHE